MKRGPKPGSNLDKKRAIGKPVSFSPADEEKFLAALKTERIGRTAFVRRAIQNYDAKTTWETIRSDIHGLVEKAAKPAAAKAGDIPLEAIQHVMDYVAMREILLRHVLISTPLLIDDDLKTSAAGRLAGVWLKARDAMVECVKRDDNIFAVFFFVITTHINAVGKHRLVDWGFPNPYYPLHFAAMTNVCVGVFDAIGDEGLAKIVDLMNRTTSAAP